MKLTVNANGIIDSLIPMFDDIQTRYEKIPRGVFIDNNSEYRAIYDRAHRAEQAFYLSSDLLGVNIPALYAAVLAARRWYTRTDWQGSYTMGYLPKALATFIAPLLDAGQAVNSAYKQISGMYQPYMNYGLAITLKV